MNAEQSAEKTLDELDRIAAEKVMGWHKIRVGERYDWQIGYDETYGNPYTIMQNHWQPTRNIAQAWECLNMVRNGLWSSVSFHVGFNKWECAIELHGGSQVYCLADTTSEAIVRACLRAKGVEL